jgi:hypothetical protein
MHSIKNVRGNRKTIGAIVAAMTILITGLGIATPAHARPVIQTVKPAVSSTVKNITYEYTMSYGQNDLANNYFEYDWTLYMRLDTKTRQYLPMTKTPELTRCHAKPASDGWHVKGKASCTVKKRSDGKFVLNDHVTFHYCIKIWDKEACGFDQTLGDTVILNSNGTQGSIALDSLKAPHRKLG